MYITMNANIFYLLFLILPFSIYFYFFLEGVEEKENEFSNSILVNINAKFKNFEKKHLKKLNKDELSKYNELVDFKNSTFKHAKNPFVQFCFIFYIIFSFMILKPKNTVINKLCDKNLELLDAETTLVALWILSENNLLLKKLLFFKFKIELEKIELDSLFQNKKVDSDLLEVKHNYFSYFDKFFQNIFTGRIFSKILFAAGHR